MFRKMNGPRRTFKVFLAKGPAPSVWAPIALRQPAYQCDFHGQLT